MKVKDLIEWLSQRDPDEKVSLAGSRLAQLVYADWKPPEEAEDE